MKKGYAGYLDINTLALKIVKEGGYLITCSCYQHLTLPLFNKLIDESVNHAKVKAKLVEMRYQARDHASLINLSESLYLKVAILSIA